MNRNIALFSVKGGVGTSTTAAILAIQVAEHAQTVLVDAATYYDQHAINGLAEPIHDSNISPVLDTLDIIRDLDPNLGDLAGEYETIIIDNGLRIPNYRNTLRVLVVDNSYVTLRRAVQLDRAAYNAVIVIMNEGWPLTFTDVQSVLNCPQATRINRDATVARGVDAGLLPQRATNYTSLAGDLLFHATV